MPLILHLLAGAPNTVEEVVEVYLPQEQVERGEAASLGAVAVVVDRMEILDLQVQPPEVNQVDIDPVEEEQQVAAGRQPQDQQERQDLTEQATGVEEVVQQAQEMVTAEMAAMEEFLVVAGVQVEAVRVFKSVEMAAQEREVKFASTIGEIMKAHILENSVIVNTIEVESIALAQELFGNAIDASVGGSIGDRFEHGLLVPKDTSVEQSLAVRHQRNLKLALSDWTQLSDAPVNKVLWAAYRQSLRDVPQQAGFPTSIDWPVAP